MFFESLESRRLMSAGISFADGVNVKNNNGKLDLSAGKGNSNLFVSEDHGTVLVQDLVTHEEVQMTGVTRISIKGNSGNDTIFYYGNSIGADIDGDSGSDRLTVLDAGNASSNVNGGSGDDQINLVYGRNTSLSGGSGNDVIMINTAAQQDPSSYDFSQSHITVDAGSGDDIMGIYAGNAVINGGSHSDILMDLSGGSASYSTKKVETIS